MSSYPATGTAASRFIPLQYTQRRLRLVAGGVRGEITRGGEAEQCQVTGVCRQQ